MIHPTAIVDDSAVIADDVEVGPYSIIGADVTLASGCVIGPHVVVKGPTSIGERTRVYQFASVGEDPQDKKYSGERTSLEIGTDNVIREYATINRGTVGGGAVTRIGNHNLLMASTHVGHDCQISNHVVFSNGASLAGHVEVGDYVILSGFALVVQFSVVGEHAFVGLGSLVNRDVAPFTIAVGNYATARGINKKGLRSRGFSDDTISALHRAYISLVRQRGDRDAAIESLADEAAAVPEVQRMIEFISSSERGIVR